MRLILTYSAKFLLTGGILYYLLTTDLLDFSLVSSITHDTTFVLKIILIVLTVIALGNLKWFILLKSQRINISFINCFYLYYMGHSFNYFLPGGIAGDAVKIGYVTKISSKKSIAVLSIIIDRVIGLLAMILVVMFFLPSLFSKINRLKWIVTDYNEMILPYFLLLSALTVTFFTILLSIVNNKKLYKKITAFLRQRKNKLNKSLLKITRAVFSYRKSGLILILDVFISAFIHITIALSLLLIGQKILNVDNISLFSYNLASIITQIISIIPLSPGGIGIGEASFAKVLYYLNDRILLGYASIYFIFRMVNILISIPGVIIFLFGHKILKDN